MTAGVSGRIDKGTEERLEMMWCQHGCHSGKEQEVYNAVRTTHCATETIDTPLRTKGLLGPFGVTDGLSHYKTCVSSMRRETDHPHTLRELRDGTFQRVGHFHQLGLGLAVVCSFFPRGRFSLLPTSASAAVLTSARVSDVIACILYVCAASFSD